jgi:uncharacterized protein
MPDYKEEIERLEEELRTTKYNKATQHHIGLVKAKIAKLKERESQRSSGSKGEGFAVRKSGNATVALLGFPSVGKSTLLSAITGAESKVGAYAFTTTTVVPGMLSYRGAQIQILDLPGIISGAARGSGRGREVLSALRQADLILFVVDATDHPERQFDILRRELHDAHVRLGDRAPDVRLETDSRGGITIYKTVALDMTDETIESILREFRRMNTTIIIRDRISVDELIDAIEGNKVYIRGAVVANKIDLANARSRNTAKRFVDLCVSATSGEGVEELKELIFSRIGFYRIFLKEVGKDADMDEPLIIRGPCSVRDVCTKLHRDFVDKFRFARVWGRSAKFPAQKVSIDHVLSDEDVLEITLR